MNALPVQKIVEASRFVRSKFAQSGWRSGLDDIEQTAALAAIETARRYKLRPRVNPFNMFTTVGFRQAALAARKAGNQFSFSERAAREGKTPDAKRVRIDGPNEPIGGVTPDARILSIEDERTVQAVRTQLRQRLERIVAALDQGDRRAAEMLLGMNEEGADEREVAWRTGMTRPAITKLVKRLTAELRGDPEARRLRGVISRGA